MAKKAKEEALTAPEELVNFINSVMKKGGSLTQLKDKLLEKGWTYRG